jgi:hypothetical protein
MTVQIEAEISHVEYTPTMCKELDKFPFEELKSGNALDNGRFVVETSVGQLAVSRWVTPKRTRSYPYQRVYDTLQYPRRVTIIPIVKDEGADGDRDYLQWDTVSLMSLLNVYVIPAYYKKAEENTDYENKITNQKLDREYITRKIQALQDYQSDALHWNLREMENLEKIADKCKHYYYDEISEHTNVQMHSLKAFNRKIEKMVKQVEKFQSESRKLAKEAQDGESKSVQPKETVMYEKGKITLTNFLGGKYHFTVDEVFQINNKLILTEKKHTRSSTLPSNADIKDGLLKLILYTNIAKAVSENTEFEIMACLGITSDNIEQIYTPSSPPQKENNLKELYQERLTSLFEESRENNFKTFAAPSSLTEKEQSKILRELI